MTSLGFFISFQGRLTGGSISAETVKLRAPLIPRGRAASLGLPGPPRPKTCFLIYDLLPARHLERKLILKKYISQSNMKEILNLFF